MPGAFRAQFTQGSVEFRGNSSERPSSRTPPVRNPNSQQLLKSLLAPDRHSQRATSPRRCNPLHFAKSVEQFRSKFAGEVMPTFTPVETAACELWLQPVALCHVDAKTFEPRATFLCDCELLGLAGLEIFTPFESLRDLDREPPRQVRIAGAGIRQCPGRLISVGRLVHRS